MIKSKVISIRVTEDEYKKIEKKAEKMEMPVSSYCKEMLADDSVSMLQLRMMLSEIMNTLSNLFLGEKLMSGKMDEMFKSLSIRMAEKDSQRLTPEQKSEVESRTARQYERCIETSVEKVVDNYYAGGEDPLGLESFAKKVENRQNFEE